MRAPMTTTRREEIVRLVREMPVRSQEELLTLLRRRGFAITQPTLSRDLKELGLVKTPTGYVTPSDLSALTTAGLSFSTAEARQEKMKQTVREYVLSVEVAGSLVILRTPPAAAQPVARAIDDAEPVGAVGTIAGDDTIFLAAKSAASARRLAMQVRSLMNRPRPARRPRN
jgi:transcriptional regulator of arginine metabolism